MANEAVIVKQFLPAIDRTCSDGTGIEKGTIVQLTDPNTASASSADNQKFGGIVVSEKIANDGITKVSVMIAGIAIVTDSGSGVTAGQLVKIAGANLVAAADDDQVENHSEVVGMALETAAASNTFLCQIGVY